jgi:tetratricopeptide (TPR) repeat protein
LQQHLDTLALERQTGRHNGMRAVFDWSWSLLSRQQQNALARLAVFVDGFSRAAGLELVNSNLATLVALVNKSLVQSVGGGRYRLHPLVGQYSLEKLLEQPKEEENAKAAHAEIYLRWLEENASLVRSPKVAEVLGAFETDLENVKLAWMWLCKYPDPTRFVALEDVVLLFDARARFNEGIRLFENALQTFEPKMTLPTNINSNVSDKAVAILSFNTAWLYIRIDKNATALQYATRADQILQNGDISLLRVKALTVLGNASRDLGNIRISLEYFQQSLVLAKELKAQHRVALALSNIGNCFAVLGDYTNALSCFKTAQEIFINLQDISNANSNTLSIIDLYLFCLDKDPTEIGQILLEEIRQAEQNRHQMQILMLKIYLMFAYIYAGNFEYAEQVKNTLIGTDVHQDDFYMIASALVDAGFNHFEAAENELIRIAQSNHAKNVPYFVNHSMYFYAKIQIQQNNMAKALPALHYLMHQKNVVKWIEVKTRVLTQQPVIQKLLPNLNLSPEQQLPWLN